MALATYRGLLLGGLVLGGVVGLGLALAQPTGHTARATVRSGVGIVPEGIVDTGGLPTEARQTQLESVAAELGVDPATVGQRLTVADRVGTRLIDFTYTAQGTHAAERGAETAAETYLDAAAQFAAMSIQTRIQALTLAAEAATAGDAEAISEDLRAAQLARVDRGAVVGHIRVTAERPYPRSALAAGIGAVMGTALAVLLALLLFTLRRPVRPRADIFGLPSVGHLPADVSPAEASRVLTPLIAGSGDAGIALMPVDRSAHSMAELLARTIPGVSWIDPAVPAQLRAAHDRGNVVVLVRANAPSRDLRLLVSALRSTTVRLLGVLTVDRRALDLADQLVSAKMPRKSPAGQPLPAGPHARADRRPRSPALVRTPEKSS